jgi:tRNA (adenine57-N1/adenine58-N1)-methyltransferase
MSPPSEETVNDPPWEILEAGTGHGSLTLHLSRAIHAANSACPPIPITVHPTKTDIVNKPPSHQSIAPEKAKQAEQSPRAEDEEVVKPFDKSIEIWESWRSRRKAIIHTVDISKDYSQHAQQIVRKFKNGMYFGNIDFHVSELRDFFEHRQNKAAPQLLLSHIILDLPGAHSHIPLVSPHLHVSGKLILFVPSITQIVDAVSMIKSLHLPLTLDRVIELGQGISSGREWDVKAVKIRAVEKSLKLEGVLRENGGHEEAMGKDTEEKEAEKKYGIVCRPKVGARVIGGGFLGVWSKMGKESDIGILEK